MTNYFGSHLTKQYVCYDSGTVHGLGASSRLEVQFRRAIQVPIKSPFEFENLLTLDPFKGIKFKKLTGMPTSLKERSRDRYRLLEYAIKDVGATIAFKELKALNPSFWSSYKPIISSMADVNYKIKEEFRGALKTFLSREMSAREIRILKKHEGEVC